MKKMLLLLLVGLILIPGWTYASAGKISGSIKYQGEKIGKIYVATLAIPPDLNEPLRLDTLDTSGYYEISGLADGTYFIGAYLDVNGNGYPGFDEPVGLYPVPVNIVDSAQVEHVDFAVKDLPRGTGSIAGTINYAGAMSGEVHVYALGLTKTPFTSYHFNWSESNEFLLDGLFGGDYIVVAFMDLNNNGIAELSEPLGAASDLIDLQDGEQRTGVELTLFDTEMYNSSISGTVYYSGDETGDIHVIAGGLTFTPITEVVAESTGDFRIDNLMFGEYYLFSYLDVNDNGSYDMGEPFSESYLEKIPLGVNHDTTGIEIFLVDQGTGAISGTVSYHGDQNGFIVVAAAGLSATPLGLSLNFQPGPYLIPNLGPGVYAVGGFMDTDQNMLPSLQEPLGIYLDDFIYLDKGDTVSGVDFTLEDSTNSSIAGTIYAPEGVSGQVFIYSLGLSISPYKETVVSDAGPYEITELGAGKYIVAAFIDVNGDSMYSMNEPVGFTTKLISVAGNSTTENVDIFLTSDPFTGVPLESDGMKPKEFALLPNYPNPFNPTTTLSYHVPRASHVTIKIYNLLGEEIATLVDSDVQPGRHQVVWDAQNVSAQYLSSGVYICRMQANHFVESRKMMLIR